VGSSTSEHSREREREREEERGRPALLALRCGLQPQV
jgi:hypothetical protein